MSLERAYIDCIECWKLMNEKNSPPKKRSELHTFIGLLMRDSAMQALEEARTFHIPPASEKNLLNEYVDRAITSCRNCNYTACGIVNVIDEFEKKQRN